MSSSNVRSAYAGVGRGAGAGQPAGALVGQRVEADPLLAAGLVEEEVGGDPVQPALEGARGVGVDSDRKTRTKTSWVRSSASWPVAGQPVGEPVDAVGVLLDDLVPRGHVAASVGRPPLTSIVGAPARLLMPNSVLTFLTLGIRSERTL